MERKKFDSPVYKIREKYLGSMEQTFTLKKALRGEGFNKN